jgi:hypothetical protein
LTKSSRFIIHPLTQTGDSGFMALWSIYPEVFSMKAKQISEGRGFRISYRQNH